MRHGELFVATMDTGRYTLRACGAQASTAREYLLAAWRVHCRQVGIDPYEHGSSVEALDDYFGVRVDRVCDGWAMRDDTHLKIKEEP